MQDAPRDAAAAHLASQTTTEQVLAALRRAHAARQRIASGGPPVSRQAVQLPDLTQAAPEPQYRWRQQACTKAAFSPCGGWLAVVLQGRQQCQVKLPELPQAIATHHVVIYSASEGFQQQVILCTGRAEPVIHWSSAAPHRLGIAQLQRQPGQAPAPTVQAAAFVVDPVAVAFFSVSSEASAALDSLASFTRVDISWSPSDCRFLLVSGQKATGRRGNHPRLTGALCIADLAQGGMVVAQAQTTSACKHKEKDMWPVASWHPGSRGIVLDWNLMLENAEGFRQAGFAMGTLPQPFYIDSAGFSADAQYVAAYGWHTDIGPGSLILDQDCGHYVLRCSTEGQQLCFAIANNLLDHPPPLGLAWLPGRPALLMRMPFVTDSGMLGSMGGRSSAVSDRVLEVETNEVQRLALSIKPGVSPFSPSGGFLVSEGKRGPRIVNLQTGRGLWDSGRSGASLSNVQPRDGLGDEDNALEVGACLGWLPSGVGILCALAGQGQQSAMPQCAELCLRTGRLNPKSWSGHS